MSDEIKRLGGGGLSRGTAPKILGAPEITETTPQILDRNTPAEPTEIIATVHEEVVVNEDRVRYKKTDPTTDTEVRVRESDTEAWETVKRLEDE